jgi:predicted lipoprotein with Yx(FWY)xxD motif
MNDVRGGEGAHGAPETRRSRWRRGVTAGIVTGVAALVLAACGSSSSSSPSSGSSGSTVAPAGSGGVVLDVRDVAGLGKVIVDAKGYVLYALTADSAGQSTCAGACAVVWPPVTLPAGAKPVGGPGTVASCLSGLRGVATGPGGRRQAAYCGRPLYRFSYDHAPGEASGFGIHSFGGVWYPVAPDGNLVETRSTSTSSTSSGAYGGYGSGSSGGGSSGGGW